MAVVCEREFMSYAAAGPRCPGGCGICRAFHLRSWGLLSGCLGKHSCKGHVMTLLLVGAVMVGIGVLLRAVPGGDGAVRKLSASGHDLTPLSAERIAELARGLSEEERHIILRKGTERPFCGLLNDHEEKGTYTCRLCGLPLFTSAAKFHSGTGWPSFFQPVDAQHVHTERDASHGMVRTEILCARCGAHLGHVFEDGPRPTGLRYCLNSASLVFQEAGHPLPPESKPPA